jgi:hypothetical protein
VKVSRRVDLKDRLEPFRDADARQEVLLQHDVEREQERELNLNLNLHLNQMKPLWLRTRGLVQQVLVPDAAGEQGSSKVA